MTSADRPVSREREEHWQRTWDALDPWTVPPGPPAAGSGARYLLTMFPYPSGDLHMGHAEVFAIEDAIARYWRLRGHQVLNPVGWDSFGLPAENAAIARGENPATYTEANIATQAASIRRYAVSFDLSRRLHTHDAEYYRWTQWLFLQLYHRGLAYRDEGWVNWCPQDATVLANEQVVGGACERCGSAVVRRELTQWFVRITDYADRLLDDMAQLEGRWPERILAMQRNWIGRSEGVQIRFADDGGAHPGRSTHLEVFTTRPETLAGVTFLAVAPGEIEAARAIGIAEPAIVRRILLPLGLVSALPALVNFSIILTKETVILSIITVPELMYQTQYMATMTFSFLEGYLALALVFSGLDEVISRFGRRIEARLTSHLSERP